MLDPKNITCHEPCKEAIDIQYSQRPVLQQFRYPLCLMKFPQYECNADDNGVGYADNKEVVIRQRIIIPAIK